MMTWSIDYDDPMAMMEEYLPVVLTWFLYSGRMSSTDSLVAQARKESG